MAKRQSGEREMKNHLFIASMCITLTSIMHAESFDSFEQALVAPEKATTLSIKKYDLAIKHLPSQLGTLINLVELDISCLENLEESYQASLDLLQIRTPPHRCKANLLAD
jgi:hypothetical protein